MKKGISFLTLLTATFVVGCTTISSSNNSQTNSISQEESSIKQDNYWQVGFDLNYKDAPLIDSLEVLDGSRISQPTFSFEPEGDTFLGWFHDEYSLVKWNFNVNKITSNRTLYAGWQSIVDSYKDDVTPPDKEDDPYDYYDPDFFPTTHAVTFVSNYESGPVVVRHVIDGLKAKAPKLTRTGYSLIGWYEAVSLESLYNFDLPIHSEITLYAKWETLIAYNVTFDLNYNYAPSPQVVVGYDGTKLSIPETPKRDQYDFIGWFKDKTLTTPWNFSFDLVEGDITLYAKWSRLPLPGVYVVVNDLWAQDGATFMLWHGANTVNTVGEPTGIRNEYYFDNVATNYLAIKRQVDTKMVGEVHSIAPTGGFGSTWNQIIVKDATPKTGSLMNSNDKYVTLQLRDNTVDEYLTTYSVEFNYNYASSPASIIKEVRAGQMVDFPINPIRSGYDFKGWYLESDGINLFNKNSAINQDITLYAGWEYIEPSTMVSVMFNYNYEGSPAPIVQSVRIGQSLTAPSVTRSGYTLEGWYKEASGTNKWKFDTDLVSTEMVLYAKWNKVEVVQKDGVFVLMNDNWMQEDATFVMEMAGKKVPGVLVGPNEFFFEGSPGYAIHLVRNVNGVQKAKVHDIAVFSQTGADYRNFGTVWNRVILRADLANNVANEHASNAVTYDLRPTTTQDLFIERAVNKHEN